MIRKDIWLILHEAFRFNIVEQMAYHSLHQNKTKGQNIVRGCRETGEPLWFLEAGVLPLVALIEEVEHTEKFVGGLEPSSFTKLGSRLLYSNSVFPTFLTRPKVSTGCTESELLWIRGNL